MTDEHSKLFAPSSAHRGMHCTASAQAAARYRDVPGEAAMEGTAFHWLFERCLVDGSEPDAYLGRTIRVEQDDVRREFLVSRDMVADCRLQLAAAREVALRPGISRVEARVDLAYIHETIFGRCDVWHFGHDRWLTIYDLKYGRVDVSPARNAQELLYALGVYRAYVEPQFGADVAGVRLMIGQPRSLVPGPRVKSWETTLADLLDFELEVKVWVHDTLSNPRFAMGDWCKYCPALGACPESQEQRRHISHLLGMTDLNAEQAARVLLLKDLLTKKIKDAEAVLLDAMLRGQKVDGWRLGTETKHRQWRDEEQAKDALVEACGSVALSPPTPAAAEKLGPDAAAVVERFAFTPPAGPKVVPAGSRAAPYVVKSAAEMFGSAK